MGRLIMNEKKYTIDNIPVSANELVKKAKEYDAEFATICLKTTSMAAKILRLNGHRVEYHKEKE